jgi:hypothetical protein
MADIDRQRVAAVRTLQALGYLYRDGEWLPPATAATPLTDAALRAALTELKAIVDLIESYEVQRWPLGNDPTVPHGKG